MTGDKNIDVEDVTTLEPDNVQMPMHPVLEVLEIVGLGQQDHFRKEFLLYHDRSL